MSVELASRHVISIRNRSFGVDIKHSRRAFLLVAMINGLRKRQHPHEFAVALNLLPGVLLTIVGVNGFGAGRDEGKLESFVVWDLLFEARK